MSKNMVAYKEVGMQLGLSGTELKEFMREERTRQDELTLAREKQEREAQLAREKQAAGDKRAEISRLGLGRRATGRFPVGR